MSIEHDIFAQMNSHSIEKSILVSILESDFLPIEREILNIQLKHELFIDRNHKLFVKAINRLRELDEPSNSDSLRQKFIDAKKWSTDVETSLLEIMSHNSLGTVKLFSHFYGVLEKNHKKLLVKRLAGRL